MNSDRISGRCDARFEAVRQEFRRNFLSRGEIGAAVCVYHATRPVVDLWGGYRDPKIGDPWREDTIISLMSIGKSMAALCVLMLVDRKLVSLEDPVARYWPGFGQNGKSTITIRQMLAGHAGLIFTDAATPGALFRWEEMIDAIERQAPEWVPGTRGAYHSTTYGFMAGELVHRVDGRRFERFFEEDVAGPLHADYRFGVPQDEFHRIADVIPNPDSSTVSQIADAASKLGRAWRIRPEGPAFFYNNRDFRTSVIPSGNGHGNARAVARIYAALANFGTLDGVRLLHPDLVRKAREVQWDGDCGLTGRDYRYGLGFFLNKPPLTPLGPNPLAFGHPGLGGAIALADPENLISFAYSPSALCAGEGVGERCESLIRATFASIA